MVVINMKKMIIVNLVKIILSTNVNNNLFYFLFLILPESQIAIIKVDGSDQHEENDDTQSGKDNSKYNSIQCVSKIIN